MAKVYLLLNRLMTASKRVFIQKAG